MDFDKVWRHLVRTRKVDLATSRGTPFVAEIDDQSIAYVSKTDQTRRQSKERFHKFFDIWFRENRRQHKYFLNEGAAQSKTATFRYLRALFTYLESNPLAVYVPEDELVELVAAPDLAQPPQRVMYEQYRILRDSELTRQLKTLYECRCQLCGYRIQLGPNRYYAEVHHIRPLGGGHDGHDSIDNMIVVCPNHHVELDYGVRQLDIDDLTVTPPHAIAVDNLAYHNSTVYGRFAEQTKA